MSQNRDKWTRARELFSFLFDVVSWTRIVAEIYNPRETIQAVSNGDVQRFTKDAVALAGVGNDLCVPARNVQNDGVPGACDFSTHLDV